MDSIEFQFSGFFRFGVWKNSLNSLSFRVRVNSIKLYKKTVTLTLSFYFNFILIAEVKHGQFYPNFPICCWICIFSSCRRLLYVLFWHLLKMFHLNCPDTGDYPCKDIDCPSNFQLTARCKECCKFVRIEGDYTYYDCFKCYYWRTHFCEGLNMSLNVFMK